MSRNNKIRERTVAYPHRIFNKISIYLLDKILISSAEESIKRYECVVGLGDGLELQIQSNDNFTAKEGRLFDYIVSRIQAISKDNTELTFFTSEILSELGQANRTENRNTIIMSLHKLQNIIITLRYDSGESIISLLDQVELIDGNMEAKVTLSQSYIDSMDSDQAKKRYININRTMMTRSEYTIELAKVLQMDGRGVTIGTGVPKPVQEISQQRICSYLSLDIDSQSSKAILRKAFNELETLGYSKYSFNGRKNSWQIHR